MSRPPRTSIAAGVAKRVEHALRAFNVRRIVAAVSSGVDSVVMLDALCALQKKLGLTIAVAHLDHQLRRVSPRDAKFVERLARDRGLEFFLESIDVAANAARDHVSAEMAGRDARYAFFTRILESTTFDAVATAHTRNDVAESIVLHLARGAGLYGMAGIPPVRSVGEKSIIRPLLEIDKSELIAYATTRGLRWREDATNRDVAIPRNRIRHKIVPELERVNPRFVEAAARSARTMREVMEHLRPEIDRAKSAIASRIEPDRCVSIAIQPLKGYFALLRSVAVYEILRHTFPGTAFGAGDVERIAGLTDRQTGARTHLEGGISAQRDRGSIVISRKLARKSAAGPVPLTVNSPARVGAWMITAREVTRGTVLFDPAGTREFVNADAITSAMTVRPWRAGDALVPLGMKARKKVSDLLTDRKVPTGERRNTLVVESGGLIVWVCGHRINDRVKITRDTRRVMELAIAPADAAPSPRKGATAG